MEISDALVTAITRELLRRLQSGEIKFSGNNTTDSPAKPKPCAGSACAKPAAGFSPAQGRRKVISEVDIIKLCPASSGIGQSVEIGSRDILTPLAEDYIYKMRITVNRIG